MYTSLYAHSHIHTSRFCFHLSCHSAKSTPHAHPCLFCTRDRVFGSRAYAPILQRLQRRLDGQLSMTYSRSQSHHIAGRISAISRLGICGLGPLYSAHEAPDRIQYRLPGSRSASHSPQTPPPSFVPPPPSLTFTKLLSVCPWYPATLGSTVNPRKCPQARSIQRLGGGFDPHVNRICIEVGDV